jgi:predicted dehydrogenase
MKLKIGIIGCGRMGERHYLAYQKIPSVDIVGFADVDKNKSKIFSKKFSKKSFTIDELIDDKQIDAIDVCSPNESHAENTIISLKKGKHVLVEKPMALKLKDCDKMILESKKNNVNLMIGQTYRFYPSSLKSKEIIDSGKIGKIKILFDHGLDPGFLSQKHDQKSFSQVGVFLDTVHDVDLLRFLTGSEVKEVYVPLMDKINDSSKVEQMGLITLKFLDGSAASIMPIVPSWNIRDRGLEIIGKTGALFVKYGEEIKVGQKNWKQYNFKYKSSPPSYEHNLQGFVNELSEFVQSIKEKRTPLVSGIDGRKNLQIILAMYESFKTKKVVKL